MIGIIQNFPPALDFISNERNIPQAKLSLYKTLTLSMQQEEFKQLFKKANNLINERLGNIIYTVMAEKSEEWLFILITKYIEIKSKPRERD
jgi:hypothetical protein